MNKVMLIGRLVVKPELRYTNSNIANTRFTIAVDRPYSKDDGQKGVDFINVVARTKSAENICNYLDKGSQIAIEGRIQTGNYTDQNGNKRTSFEIMAQNVQFLGRKDNSANIETNNVENDNSTSDEDVFSQFGEQVNIDDNFLEDDFLE